MTPMIEARGLVKRYGDVTALAGLDLLAPAGQVLAVLGPNGAGKTTFIRAIATLTKLDGGSLQVAGLDVSVEPEAVRRAIGLAGQYAAVEASMSGRENLRMVARLFGHGRRQSAAAADAVLERLGLTDVADRRVGTYSGGLRRRLDLGASLVGAPRLLLLDEPTTGLDPRSRAELWRAIDDLVAGGTDVVLTTQYLEEADRLADQIALIDRGHLVASGTADDLKGRVGLDVVDVRIRDAVDLARATQALGAETAVDTGSGRLSLPAAAGPDTLVAALQALARAGVAVSEIALRRPSLDDAFLALTGHPSTGQLRPTTIEDAA